MTIKLPVKRRELLATAAAFALAPRARAQAVRRTIRIGWLAGTHIAPEEDHYLHVFSAAMAELGYAEGRNLKIELRYLTYDEAAALRTMDQYFALLEATTRELAAIPVDAIIARHTITAEGAARATRTVPIVMGAAANPIAVGLIESLSRPGGNVTGLTLDTADVTAKRLQLLKEVMPDLHEVGLIYPIAGKNYPVAAEWLKACEDAARVLDLAFVPVDLTFRNFPRWDDLLAQVAASGLKALYASETPYYLQRHAKFGELAMKHRLAIMGFAPEMARSGCLIAYGVEVSDLFRRAAVFVDKIVKGADPATLPVEQPTRFKLSLNLRAAKVLGLSVPRAILAHADEITE